MYGEGRSEESFCIFYMASPIWDDFLEKYIQILVLDIITCPQIFASESLMSVLEVCLFVCLFLWWAGVGPITEYSCDKPVPMLLEEFCSAMAKKQTPPSFPIYPYRVSHTRLQESTVKGCNGHFYRNESLHAIIFAAEFKEPFEDDMFSRFRDGIFAKKFWQCLLYLTVTT